MLLQTVIGSENWPSGGTKLHLFVCPTHRYPLEGKEAHLWMISNGLGGGRPQVGKVGNPQVISAGVGLKPEIVGKWTTMVYDMPEHVLIKLMVQRSGPQGSATANLLLHTRDTAANRRIVVNTIANPKSAMDRLVLEGRFDIFDLAEAAALGYMPNRMYLPTFQTSRWERMPYLTLTELAPETAAAARVVRQTVQNSQGDAVEVQSSHTRRALDL